MASRLAFVGTSAFGIPRLGMSVSIGRPVDMVIIVSVILMTIIIMSILRRVHDAVNAIRGPVDPLSHDRGNLGHAPQRVGWITVVTTWE